jgi:hypothetical protein
MSNVNLKEVTEFVSSIPGAIRITDVVVAEVTDYPTSLLSGAEVQNGTYARVAIEVLVPMPTE